MTRTRITPSKMKQMMTSEIFGEIVKGHFGDDLNREAATEANKGTPILRTTDKTPTGIILNLMLRGSLRDTPVKAIIADETNPERLNENIEKFIKAVNDRKNSNQEVPLVDTVGLLIRKYQEQAEQPQQMTRSRSIAILPEEFTLDKYLSDQDEKF